MNKKMPSDKQEKLIASLLGWHQVSGSGARSCLPGDIESHLWLGECKTHVTPGHSIIFNRLVWAKIAKESQSKFKVPVLFVDDGSQKIETTWVMFPYKAIQSKVTVSVSYPFNIQKNISFNHQDMIEFYKCSFASQCQTNQHLVVTLDNSNFDKRVLGIVPLNVFCNVYGEF